jgi:transketolase
MVSSVVAANCPKQVISMALPDAPVITGKSPAVFAHYGLNAEGIVANLLKY